MPSLPNLPDPSSSPSTHYSQHSHALPEGSDKMLMLTVNKFCYLVQAHCALSSWPEWCPLQKENEKTLGDFIFEEILCRWGGVTEIVTDNGPAFVAVAGYLSEKYGI